MSHVWSLVLCIQLSLMSGSAAVASTTVDSAPDQAQQQPARKAAPQAKPMQQKQPDRDAPEDISKIPPPTGPMRLLFHSITEVRNRVAEGVEGAPPSTLRLTATMTGERLAEIVGIGGLVVDEMIDDTGAVLAKPEDVTEQDRTFTQQVKISAKLMRMGSFQRTREINAVSNRAARKLSKVTGWVNVVYGHGSEEILIDNPLQYVGGLIDNARLKELGIGIEVVEVGPDVRVDPKLGKGVGLRYTSSRKQIRSVEFFDAWMRPVHPRETLVTPEDGSGEYVYFPFTVGQADADTQLLLVVHEQIEEDKVSFEFNDIELP